MRAAGDTALHMNGTSHHPRLYAHKHGQTRLPETTGGPSTAPVNLLGRGFPFHNRKDPQ